VRVNIASNYSVKDDAGTWEERTRWNTLTVFGKQAEWVETKRQQGDLDARSPARELVQIRIKAGLPIIGHDRGALCCWRSEDYVGGTSVEHPRHGSTDDTGPVLEHARSKGWMVTISWSVSTHGGHSN
jgi:hypothetical protein